MTLWHHVTSSNYYISTTTVSMAMTFGGMVTCHEGLLTIKSHNVLIMWSCKVMWQTKIIISLLPEWLWPPNLIEWWHTLRHLKKKSYIHMNDNLTWWVTTYKLHQPLITWSCKITWKTKTIISPLQECLWQPHLTER